MDIHKQGRKNKLFLLTWILAGLLLLNQAFCQPAPVRIGLSKASPNYENWLKLADPSIRTVDLYPLSISEAVQQLSQCSGLVLTGGEDVWPGRYGRLNDTLRCTEMNPHRDSLEIALIEKALALKMPLIGICRGNQILNVFLGGTLVIDIPKDVGTKTIHQCEDYLNCFHAVNVRKSSLLANISMCESAQVTTNHHQAVDRLSTLLVANAFSEDKLIEGVEWINPDDKSFLLGVQWHPERMDRSNPLSGRIAEEFLLQTITYSYKQTKIRKK
jgi:putative glutamine amidotransferase